MRRLPGVSCRGGWARAFLFERRPKHQDRTQAKSGNVQKRLAWEILNPRCGVATTYAMRRRSDGELASRIDSVWFLVLTRHTTPGAFKRPLSRVCRPMWCEPCSIRGRARLDTSSEHEHAESGFRPAISFADLSGNQSPHDPPAHYGHVWSQAARKLDARVFRR